MPKVSVIIPVYNSEAYLNECLDSILGQTLKDIEVLCIDDGCTDRSPVILAERAAADPRVRLFSSDHAGAFRAREVGVRAATGEYLYFMDSDDLLDVHALESLCDLADRESLDQVVFASSVFCEADVPASSREWAKVLIRYYSFPSGLAGKVMTGMELMARLIEIDGFHVSPPLRLTRASVYKDNAYGFPDARSRADNYFTPISLYYSKRVCGVTDRYYRRRVRNDSITTGAGAEQRHFRNMFQVLLGLIRFAPFASEAADPKTAVSRMMMRLVSSLHRWVWKLDVDERTRLLSESLETATAEERAQLFHLVLLAQREFKRRPIPTFRGGFAFLAKRVWKVLKGPRPHTWYLK